MHSLFARRVSGIFEFLNLNLNYYFFHLLHPERYQTTAVTLLICACVLARYEPGTAFGPLVDPTVGAQDVEGTMTSK